MKRFFTLFVIYIVFSSWFNVPTAQAQGVPDPTLAAAVRRYLELEPTDPINWAELKEFSDVSGSIKSLKGLELATNLVHLEIFDSPIRDLTPLTNLKNLRELTLLWCEISDITPLAGLIHLKSLVLSRRLGSRNRISDITPIAGLIQLEYLDLAYNAIRDIRPVAGLTQLNTLTLAVNQISDITPIAGLTQLESLGLEINQISDITPLARLTRLVSLSIGNNQISDITPLARLTALEGLSLGGNEFRDITPLAGMTRLEALDLHGNQINDLTPLIGMTELEALDLGGNQINDIAPLAGLTQLRALGLSANQINDLTPLAGLRKLEALFLACNQISDITPLIGLTKLERLDLEEHWSVDADRLKTLPKLTKLRFRGDPFDTYFIEIVSPNVHTLNFPITPLRNFQPACATSDPKQETPPQIADMDRITISEIMVTSNGASLPQWIELYNPSNTQTVSLKGWTLEVQNRRSANFNGHLNVTLTFKERSVEPQETLMIVSKQGRASDNFPNEQTYTLDTLHPKLRDMVLSEEGFYLKLSNKAGELIDVVGNLDGKRNTNDTPAWSLPASLTEDGARASMVRRHDDGIPRLGTDASGWISAMNTKLTTGTTTYYGHPNDIGAPGVKSGGALPVTLSHFRAERVEAGVVVKWTTESEVDNAGFNILRSETKNGEFKVVNPQLIQGAGTTSERHTYTWKDTAAQPNVAYYYRIKDVSHAGIRKQLATVRMRGLVSASGKLTTRWADLKL